MPSRTADHDLHSVRPGYHALDKIHTYCKEDSETVILNPLVLERMIYPKRFHLSSLLFNFGATENQCLPISGPVTPGRHGFRVQRICQNCRAWLHRAHYSNRAKTAIRCHRDRAASLPQRWDWCLLSRSRCLQSTSFHSQRSTGMSQYRLRLLNLLTKQWAVYEWLMTILK